MKKLLQKLNSIHEKTHPFSLGFFEVNLKNLEDNIIKIKDKNALNNSNLQYLLPVKGGGYGCGMKEISQFVQEKKLVNYLGVAHAQEAFELRESGITLPILILGQTAYSEKFVEFIAKNSIEIAISEEKSIDEIEKYFSKTQNIQNTKKISVHLKIDLGMGRCGILEEKVLDLFQKIIQSNTVEIKGIMMHFPVSDSDISDYENFTYTETQIENFAQIKEKIKKLCEQENQTNIYKNIIFHTANSGASTEHSSATFDMIRPGIASYGYPEPGSGAEKLQLQPVVKIYSHFTLLKDFPKNFSIGYGRTYYAENKNEKIGILPIGYADGLNRLLSNKYSIFSENHEEFKCVGRISMDQSAYKIMNTQKLPDADIKKQKVYILGNKHNAREIAQKLNTISYEILLNLGTSDRLRKIYSYE